jgi:phosphopantetheinyl transferase (holo-ACP synthase)
MQRPLDIHEVKAAAADLAQRAFADRGIITWGVALGCGKRWREASGGPLMTVGDPLPPYPIGHDERKAPFLLMEDGTEVPGMLVSFTDENGVCLCIWAVADETGPVAGLGADLASTEDFEGNPSDDRFIKLLLKGDEAKIAESIRPDDHATGYAAAFSAKEAAFKSTARALRTWYETHDEELTFEVRDFEMTEPGLEKGTARTGRAQVACDKLGISRIEVLHAPMPGAVLTFALALR